MQPAPARQAATNAPEKKRAKPPEGGASDRRRRKRKATASPPARPAAPEGELKTDGGLSLPGEALKPVLAEAVGQPAEEKLPSKEELAALVAAHNLHIPGRERGPKSWVWQFCMVSGIKGEDTPQKGFCLLCRQVICEYSPYTATTSSFLRHLLTFHKNVRSVAQRIPAGSGQAGGAGAGAGGVGGALGGGVAGAVGADKDVAASLSPAQQEELADEVVAWVLQTGLAPSVLDHERTRSLFRALQPRFTRQPSSLEALSRGQTQLVQAKESMRLVFRSLPMVSLTVLGWTAQGNVRHEAVLCHFMTPALESKTCLLALRAVQGAATPTAVAAALGDVVREFQLEKKVAGVMTLAVSHEARAAELLGYRVLRCPAHGLSHTAATVLRLSVDRLGQARPDEDTDVEGEESSDDEDAARGRLATAPASGSSSAAAQQRAAAPSVVRKLRVALERVARSPAATEALRPFLPAVDASVLGRSSDFGAQFPAAFQLLSRLCEHRENLRAALKMAASEARVQRLLPTPAEWTWLDRVLRVLEPVYEVCQRLLTSVEATASWILPAVRHTYLSLSKRLAEESDPALQKILRFLVREVETRYNSYGDVCAVAMALDPRVKLGRNLCPEEDFKRNETFFRVRAREAHARRAKQLAANASPPALLGAAPVLPPGMMATAGAAGSNAGAAAASPVADSAAKAGAGTDGMALFFRHAAAAAPSPAAELESADSEVDRYLASPTPPDFTQLVRFWRARAETFPTLYEVAREVLCMPATTLPAEQFLAPGTHLVSLRRGAPVPGSAEIAFFWAVNGEFLRAVAGSRQPPQ